jgi:thiol-disulfide isomerase/thioredoxin
VKYVSRLILGALFGWKPVLMIRNQSAVLLLTTTAAIGLILAPAMQLLASGNVNAAISDDGRTSSATLALLPLAQNGNTQNHFMIDKSQFKKAPEFTGITGYINTNSAIKLADLRGKVVLVHFWTYPCINCIHTIPHLNDWYQKYSNKGLVIVGVQTPEFSDEKNIDNVKAAVNNFQIKYPVILDNNYATWNAYGNNYWPRDYLVDNQGYVRYSHIGEGDYSQTEQMIQSLLAEGVIT